MWLQPGVLALWSYQLPPISVQTWNKLLSQLCVHAGCCTPGNKLSLWENTSKQFLPFVFSKSTLFQFKFIIPCAIPTCPCKMSFSSFLAGPFRYRKAERRSPVATLSAFPHRRDVPALGSFLWSSSGPAPTGCMSFLCWGLQSWT